MNHPFEAGIELRAGAARCSTCSENGSPPQLCSVRTANCLNSSNIALPLTEPSAQKAASCVCSRGEAGILLLSFLWLFRLFQLTDTSINWNIYKYVCYIYHIFVIWSVLKLFRQPWTQFLWKTKHKAQVREHLQLCVCQTAAPEVPFLLDLALLLFYLDRPVVSCWKQAAGIIFFFLGENTKSVFSFLKDCLPLHVLNYFSL